MSNNTDYYYEFLHCDYQSFNMYMNFIDWPNLPNSVGELDDTWDNFMHILVFGLIILFQLV